MPERGQEGGGDKLQLDGLRTQETGGLLQLLRQLERQRDELRKDPVADARSESKVGNDAADDRRTDRDPLRPGELPAAGASPPDPGDANGDPVVAEDAAAEGSRENGEEGAPSDDARRGGDDPNAVEGDVPPGRGGASIPKRSVDDGIAHDNPRLWGVTT
mmetsp:Transcript_36768/g.78359  ORF Transcript_36768/g.78359 Transcript_36768/m.78359 type:complete len:160 (-) Transcript_36768:166-645(-)